MAKGIVLKSFASTIGTFEEGQEIEIPKGVDWVKAGLVRTIPATKKRKAKATKPKGETATQG